MRHSARHPPRCRRGARRRERRRAYPGPRSKNTGGGALAKSAVRKVNMERALRCTRSPQPRRHARPRAGHPRLDSVLLQERRGWPGHGRASGKIVHSNAGGEPDSLYHRETAASRVLLTQHPGQQPRLRSVSKRTLVAPAIADRLIGNAAMIGTIGLLIYGVAAAEEEISPAGIADRPSAGFLIQLQQSLALLDWNFDQLRFRLDVIVIGEGGIAADRWSRHPH